MSYLNNHIPFELKHMREGESIQMILRRHWITLVYLGLYFFFLIVSTAIAVALRSTLPDVIAGELFWITMILYWSVFLMFIYVFWMNNELDFIIVTNQRVIGVEQRTFLDRNIAECSIDRVQEVDARTTGLLSNLLDF